MIAVYHTIHHEHDFSLVVLALVLCAFGSWVVSKLYRHALTRPRSQAVIWYILTAITAGIAIWCTHFIAILAYQPDAPISFDLLLTLASLIIAIIGSTFGIMLAGLTRTRLGTVMGGTIFGLAISAMHYSGMVAYRVQGAVLWDYAYLLASVLIAVVFGIVALLLGSRPGKAAGWQMTGVLTLAIVGLHFTGMAAFKVSSIGITAGYTNPGEYKLLAFVIAGTAFLMVLSGLFTNFVENRTRMESIEELRQARDAAESASRAKSEFMSVLSHELRTPLTIVIGYAGFLSNLKTATLGKLKNKEPITEAHFHAMGDQTELYGKRVRSAGDHLLTIINDILDYTSIELNDIKLTQEDFPVRKLLLQIEDQFQGLAAERAIKLHTECDDAEAYADRGRCLQILINLVGNGLKFSRADNIYLRARVVGTSMVFEVEDDGCGIEQTDLDRIFLAFQQISNPENRAEGGTGLGLAICKKLATAHGGDVTVQSTVGSGTKFTVYFPDSTIGVVQKPIAVAA